MAKPKIVGSSGPVAQPQPQQPMPAQPRQPIAQPGYPQNPPQSGYPPQGYPVQQGQSTHPQHPAQQPYPQPWGQPAQRPVYQSSRPEGVVILTMLCYFEGVLLMLFGGIFLYFILPILKPLAFILLIIGGDGLVIIGYVCLSIFFVIGSLFILLGWGLWNLKQWARRMSMLLALVGVFAFPVGTAVGLLMIYYLKKPEIKCAFQ